MGTVSLHRANTIGFAILLAIVVLSPLPFGANRPFFWFLIAALLGMLVLWWSTLALASREARATIIQVPFARFKIEAGLMAALVLWFLLQVVPLAPQSWHHSIWSTAGPLLSGAIATISAAPEAGMDAWVRFLAYGAVFFLAMQYGRNPARARLALWSVAVAGIVFGLYGMIIQLAGFDSILWYRRWAYHDSLTATFINRNSFAAFGGITLICCVALLTRIERRAEVLAEREGRGAYLERLAAHGLPLVIGAIIILSAILLSHSRAGLLATALGLATFYLCRRGHKRPERQNWWRFTPLLLAFALFAVVMISGAATWSRVDREALGDAGGRVNIYTATWRGIGDRPWLGHGLGSYRWVFESYRTPSLVRAGIIDKAHNSYLEFAFEAGVPAFLI